MQNKLTTALLSFALCTAAAADLDLSDFDTFLMQDMDAAVKELEPLLGAKDAGAATATAEFLRDGLEWTERYFDSKGNAADGVGFARNGREGAEAVLASLRANDFAAATEAARNVARSCRACHDVYRP